MNCRKCLLIAWILSLTFALHAQYNEDKSRWAAKLQYVGEFVLHPGLSIGTEYILRANNWYNLHWDTEMGGYVHKRNNNSVFLQSTVGARLTTKFAVFVDIQGGMGFMLSTPDGEVYSVDDTGDLNLGGRPVSSHLKPTLSIFLGWDGKRNRDILFSVFAGPEVYMQSAYNHIMLPHIAYRVGISYQL